MFGKLNLPTYFRFETPNCCIKVIIDVYERLVLLIISYIVPIVAYTRAQIRKVFQQNSIAANEILKSFCMFDLGNTMA